MEVPRRRLRLLVIGVLAPRSYMPFEVGDKVVYPHHGAATIERLEKVSDPLGVRRDYLVLRLAYGELTLKVPADNAAEIGLRDVINDEEVEEVFAVLRKREARMPTNWSRRFKNHVEKLKSGDIYQVAEVVRNLTIRERDKGLSAGEKRMLGKARQILVSELTFALNVDEDTAEIKLDEVLGKTGGVPTPKPIPDRKPLIDPTTPKRAVVRKPKEVAAPTKKAPTKKAPAKAAAKAPKAETAEKAPAVAAPAKKAATKTVAKAVAKKAPAKAVAKKAPAKKAVAKKA